MALRSTRVRLLYAVGNAGGCRQQREVRKAVGSEEGDLLEEGGCSRNIGVRELEAGVYIKREYLHHW